VTTSSSHIYLIPPGALADRILAALVSKCSSSPTPKPALSPGTILAVSMPTSDVAPAVPKPASIPPTLLSSVSATSTIRQPKSTNAMAVGSSAPTGVQALHPILPRPLPLKEATPPPIHAVSASMPASAAAALAAATAAASAAARARGITAAPVPMFHMAAMGPPPLAFQQIQTQQMAAMMTMSGDGGNTGAFVDNTTAMEVDEPTSSWAAPVDSTARTTEAVPSALVPPFGYAPVPHSAGVPLPPPRGLPIPPNFFPPAHASLASAPPVTTAPIGIPQSVSPASRFTSMYSPLSRCSPHSPTRMRPQSRSKCVETGRPTARRSSNARSSSRGRSRSRSRHRSRSHSRRDSRSPNSRSRSPSASRRRSHSVSDDGSRNKASSPPCRPEALRVLTTNKHENRSPPMSPHETVRQETASCAPMLRYVSSSDVAPTSTPIDVLTRPLPLSTPTAAPDRMGKSTEIRPLPFGGQGKSPPRRNGAACLPQDSHTDFKVVSF